MITIKFDKIEALDADAVMRRFTNYIKLLSPTPLRTRPSKLSWGDTEIGPKEGVWWPSSEIDGLDRHLDRLLDMIAEEWNK